MCSKYAVTLRKDIHFSSPSNTFLLILNGARLNKRNTTISRWTPIAKVLSQHSEVKRLHHVNKRIQSLTWYRHLWGGDQVRFHHLLVYSRLPFVQQLVDAPPTHPLFHKTLKSYTLKSSYYTTVVQKRPPRHSKKVCASRVPTYVIKHCSRCNCRLTVTKN